MNAMRANSAAYRLLPHLFIAIMCCGLASWRVARAADVIKANNTDNLNVGGSWTSGTPPGAGDVGVWDSTVTGNNSVALGGNLSWQGLRLDSANPPGGDVTLTGSNSLTLGTAGLNVGSTDFTWASSSNFNVTGGSGTFAGSSTFTLGGAATKNWGNNNIGITTVTFTGNLVLRGGTGNSGTFSNNWVAFGQNNGVSQTGAFHLDTGDSLTDRGELIVTQGWGDGTGGRSKLTLASLTGFGDFRCDYGSNSIRTVLVDQSSNTTFRGRIVSASYNVRAINLEKAGTGTLELTGNNTINSTLVTAGTLKVSGAGQFGSGRPMSVNSGATFEWARDGAVTSPLSGAGTILRSTTAGNAAFSGSNESFTGNWLVTAGYVGLVSDATVGDQNVGMTLNGGGIYFTTTGQTLAASRTITLGAAGGILNGSTGHTGTFASTFTGSGGLSKVSGATAILTAENDFAGATTVSTGTLLVNGALANTSGVSIASGATLGGSGSINAVLSGAGLVSPGNSPGITTATGVDPSGGTAYAFEFTATGSPTYSNATASVNDVLRLTDGTTPFVASLSGGNVVDVYFDVASLGGGDSFKGGFYTDLQADFLTSVENGSYAYWVKGNGTGTDRTFNGQGYFSLSNFDSGLSVTLSTVAETANFAGGSVNGQVMEFAVVPEPSTLMLTAAGLGLAGWQLARGRRPQKL